MPRSLPLHANLEWLRKEAKDLLKQLRAADPAVTLSQAQLALARDCGFPSWRKLKAHVDEVRAKLDAVPKPAKDAPPVAPNDPDLMQLLAAINAGDLKVVTTLLGKRPELSRAHGPEGQTPLHVAAQCDDNRLAVFLLACGADPKARYGESGHTALSWAITCHAMAFAQTLVRLGHKPDLFCAAGLGLIDDVAKFFDPATGQLVSNASATGSSRFGPDRKRLPCPPTTDREVIADALCMACRNAQEPVVRFLLGKDVELSFRGFMGGMSLHWAYYSGSHAIVQLLEQAGADRDCRDTALGCTPRAFGICVPANWGFVGMVRARLDQDPSLANFMDGRTSALHEASRAGHVDVVRLLLERGAHAMLKNGDGTTALELAQAAGHGMVVEVLRQAVAAATSST